MSPKLKWTIKGRLEIVYTGTLKSMERYTGYARLFHGDNLYGEGECIDGVKVGPWKHYHADGQLMQECTYGNKGKEEGVCRHYHANGQLSSEEWFLSGKLDGECRTWYEDGAISSLCQHDNGKRLESREYYPNGGLRMVMLFENDKFKSEVWYREDGSLWRQT
ncbi:hypothetical protein L2750_11520 [Shewanella submarina]|uniref:Toxin-antitoxin system YwqK family antitoxin n=1 Tax=Shewanella submarina TaxID=2016376 RepID=A0ABV7GBB8_9GAMM|nr:hypothetical protein [Shewanella submarina]MCL1037781.1 hypothetical protein [Shewanella submarina]